MNVDRGDGGLARWGGFEPAAMAGWRTERSIAESGEGRHIWEGATDAVETVTILTMVEQHGRRFS
jgi:hypothetical protein